MSQEYCAICLRFVVDTVGALVERCLVAGIFECHRLHTVRELHIQHCFLAERAIHPQQQFGSGYRVQQEEAEGVLGQDKDPPQALGPVGMVCERACVSLRPCLCITKPILGVQAWPGLARQRFCV